MGESYTEPSAAEKELPWPEHTRGLLLGRAVDALRVGDARVDDEQRQTLDELGFEWGDRRISGLSWNEFLGCLFSFSKIKGSLNVRWDFVVPNEDPWPLPLRNAPLGRWVNEVRAQQPVFERHFAERKRFLDLMGSNGSRLCSRATTRRPIASETSGRRRACG